MKSFAEIFTKLKPKWRVFEEWCQFEEGNRENHSLGLGKYKIEHGSKGTSDVDLEFVKAVRDAALSTDDNLFVSTEAPGNNLKFLKIDLADDGQLKTFSPQTKSHIFRLNLESCERSEITAALIRDLGVSSGAGPIKLERCYVGVMLVRSGARADIELRNCWIGTLILTKNTVLRLYVKGGSIREIECPPPHGENPFIGSVTFSDVNLPTSPKSMLLRGPQTYSSLRSHLEDLKNVPAANLMRARELATERHDDQGLTWWVNGTYQLFCDHGLRPGRPLACAALAYGIAFALIVVLDGGRWSSDPYLYFGWRTGLREATPVGDIARSALLCLQSIINPFGIFGARSLVIPNSGMGQVILMVQGLFTDLMLFLTILGIRRRFKLP